MDLDEVFSKLNKTYGPNTITWLGKSPENIWVETVPSGSLSLDAALGGGYPKGRIVEVYGPESSGKTTVCIHAAAEAQKVGLTTAFIDMEHAFDPKYAQNLGINLDELAFSQPESGEQALEICEALVRGGINLVVIDSVAALVPRAELEGDMGDSPMGMQARLMSQALRKMSGAIKATNAIVIFTNQLRQKIGVMFGNPETTTGGMALKFYASQRLDVRRIQSIKTGDSVIGGRTRVRVVKNKVAPPFREAEFDIIYGTGISKTGEVIDIGVSTGVITKRGSFFYYAEEKLGQGKENARESLRQNEPLMEELTAEISKRIKSGVKTTSVEGTEDGDN